MRQLYVLLFFAILLLAASCKDPYTPAETSVNNAYLVVEGNISLNGETTVKLSRTLKLKDPAGVTTESGARVSVESAGGSSFDLFETAPGVYQSSQTNTNPEAKYRLHIHAGNKEYVSDYTEYRQTPPIDSVSWKVTTNGVQVYANTHDPQNASRYYKWNYDETWEIHSPYGTQYKYANGAVNYDFSQNTSICWKYGQSTNIILGSSAKLQNDVITESPVLFIPYNDEKINYRYSVLLTQQAIDQKAYTYFDVMKRNTESLGSIFDAQASELRGNIHSISDPNEIVIGYVTASGKVQKRLFIKNDELQNWHYSLNCETILVPNNRDSFEIFYPNLYLPYSAKTVGPTIVGYYSSFPECVDCTLRGSNIKPSYW